MNDDLAIEVDGVSKAFFAKEGRVDALAEVSLSVRKGEFVSLLGPSGCGKSTLLSIIAGLTHPSTGTVRVAGRAAVEAKDDIGMMFQSPVLLAWRTTLKNVLLPIELDGGRAAARRKTPEARRLLERVGLTGFESKLPHQLSGGMQQRTAICRMLISQPEVLLLDEPFSALDEITRERMNLELAEIMAADGERATLFVTHSIQEAVFLSDRVMVMSERPGIIADVIDVKLPRPRTPDIITTPAFQALAREARELLNLGTPASPPSTDETSAWAPA
jgi:NitT/TauT family transport system ATP-binding protein